MFYFRYTGGLHHADPTFAGLLSGPIKIGQATLQLGCRKWGQK